MGLVQLLEDLSKDDSIKALFATVILIQLIVMVLVSFGTIPVAKPVAVSDTILGSILATLSAYLLYWQVQLQERQADVEEKMLDYETKPLLEIVDKDFEGNSAEVLVANYGHGVCVDLRLKCRVTAPEVDWFEGVDSSTPIKRKDGDTVLEDTSIRPQEEPDTYWANTVTIGRRIDESEEDHSTFETTMWDLLDEEGAEVHVGLWATGKPKVGDYTVQEKICDKFVIESSTNIPRPDLQNSYQFQK